MTNEIATENHENEKEGSFKDIPEKFAKEQTDISNWCSFFIIICCKMFRKSEFCEKTHLIARSGGNSMQDVQGVKSHYILALLTMSYLVGEMGHFMLGATSRDMAREIGESNVKLNVNVTS